MSLHPRATYHVAVLLFSGMFLFAPASAGAGATAAQSDPSAVTWAMKAVGALTGGIPVVGATLQGNVIRSDDVSGASEAITLQATGNSASRIDITTGSGVRSLLRAIDGKGRPNGTWIDTDSISHDVSLHNCWTDAVWFFPALSMLSGYTDPSLVFVDVGAEQRNGVNVEHIRIFRSVPANSLSKTTLIAKLSRVDYYLDSGTAVPIAMEFADHPNDDALTDINVEVDYSDFHLVGNRIVPYGITRLQNGNPQFQIAISSATLN